MGVRVELAAGSVEIQRMADYLLVVERGVASVDTVSNPMEAS